MDNYSAAVPVVLRDLFSLTIPGVFRLVYIVLSCDSEADDIRVVWWIKAYETNSRYITMVTVMPFCIRLGQGWMVIVLLDVVILGLGRAVQVQNFSLLFKKY